MIPARRTGALVAAVITDVRTWVGDLATDPQGNTITALRFSTGDVVDAINLQLASMQMDAEIENGGEGVLRTDVTYTETDGGMNLPSGVPADAGIVLIEAVQAGKPIRLRPVGLSEIEGYSSIDVSMSSPYAEVYAIVGATSGIGARILVRPSGSHSLRVWYVAMPLEMVADASDTVVPLSARFREYLAVGAAVRLLEPTGDVTNTLQVRYDRCHDQFIRFCSRLRAHDSIRMEYPNV